jgi:GTP-binding protein
VADIPGLIEGSHTGRGLGIRFLKHIERTKILSILVPSESEDPEAEARMLLHELSEYSPVLAAKPKCFFLSKSDLLPPEAANAAPPGWHSFSSATGAGIQEALVQLKRLLDEQDDPSDT